MSVAGRLKTLQSLPSLLNRQVTMRITVNQQLKVIEYSDNWTGVFFPRRWSIDVKHALFLHFKPCISSVGSAVARSVSLLWQGHDLSVQTSSVVNPVTYTVCCRISLSAVIRSDREAYLMPKLGSMELLLRPFFFLMVRCLGTGTRFGFWFHFLEFCM